MAPARLAAPLAIAALAAVALLAPTACGGTEGEGARLIVDGTVLASPAPATAAATVAPLPLTPAPYPSDLDPEQPAGFAYPIEGACLPDSEALLPNAPRPYRNGVHEGIDWYDRAGCAAVGLGTPVLAMFDGVVIRADRDYEELTAAEVEALAAGTEARGFSDPETLDRYRGRQVWVDHGNGVVTRYAHLATIAPGVFVGAEVRRGRELGGVGESGTPESVLAPGTEWHLHAEVRVGESFLGAGLPLEELRRRYELLFAEPAAGR